LSVDAAEVVSDRSLTTISSDHSSQALVDHRICTCHALHICSFFEAGRELAKLVSTVRQIQLLKVRIQP
jgi:hypothetical protein